MEFQVAADPAERTDGGGHLLGILVPSALGTHIKLRPEGQGPGGTHADAVAAVDARRVRQGHVGLGRDVGVKAPAGRGNRIGVLRIVATCLDRKSVV